MFKKNKSAQGYADLTEMAAARTHMYDLMVWVFNRLPDAEFLQKIQTREFENLFAVFAGAAQLKSYRAQAEINPPTAILEELSVDRTRILRGTGPKDLKPPHEGCYKTDCDLGSAAAQVKCFYRTAGLQPDATVCESPDYLCVQLDFMRCLCQEEQDLRACSRDVSNIVACQRNFLTNHLGSWLGEYCEQVQKHAQTDFYRGLASILNEFIAREMDYLDDLKY